jgi:hypothetical protein
MRGPATRRSFLAGGTSHAVEKEAARALGSQWKMDEGCGWLEEVGVE